MKPSAVVHPVTPALAGRGIARVGRALAASLLVAGALFVGACSGGSGVPAAGAPGRTETGIQGLQSTPPPSFLARMPDAPERVPHSGLRRVEYHVDVDGVPSSLVYEERVTADGTGHYAIEPVSVQEPALTLPQREIFEELQRARQGFFFKYRDLRVRDLDLFLANYSVRVLASAPVVAGVECVEIEVTARRGARGSYRMAVDAATGLVMRSEERDASGALVASTAFLEFTSAPVLHGVDFHVERHPGTPIEHASLPTGFTPARPQILPDGYREMSSEVLELAGDTYVRRVYGDGLENVFFLQREEPNPTVAQIHAGSTVKVRMAQVGAFRVAEAELPRGNFFVVGKVSEADVLGILRSAL